MKFVSYILQGACYMLVLGIIAYCSNQPRYQQLPSGHAVIKLSVKHSGQILGQCRVRTVEELAKLPPNMRAPKVCPRERSALLVELKLDDDTIYKGQIRPSGLSGDGMASIYKRFSVPKGQYQITVRMKDRMDLDEYNYQNKTHLDLKAEQVLVIDFKPDKGGFIFL